MKTGPDNIDTQSTVLVAIDAAHSEHVALACASAVREGVRG